MSDIKDLRTRCARALVGFEEKNATLVVEMMEALDAFEARNVSQPEGDRMSITSEEIENRVTYHAPSPSGAGRHSTLSAVIADAMRVVNGVVPEGREKSLALTKLEEAKFWASAGVARNPETV